MRKIIMGLAALIVAAAAIAILAVELDSTAVKLNSTTTSLAKLRQEVVVNDSKQTAALHGIASDQSSALSGAIKTAVQQAVKQDSQNQQKLGICYSTSSETFSGLVDQTMDGYAFVTGLSIDQPVIHNGVLSCPSGDQFAPVTAGS